MEMFVKDIEKLVVQEPPGIGNLPEVWDCDLDNAVPSS